MDFSHFKIMIVDDDDLFRKYLSSIIRKVIFAVPIEAKHPKEAFEILSREIPDLIILDMEMPYMDGYTMLKQIRANEATMNIPVVPCSSLSSELLIRNLAKLKIDGYIFKYNSKDIITKKIIDELTQLEKKNLQ